MHDTAITETFRFAASSPADAALEAKVTAAFELLGQPIYRYLLAVLRNREEAEDLTQECFLRLCRHARNGFEIENVRLWLFTLAHNLALNRRNASHFETTFDLPNWTQVLEKRTDPGLNPEQSAIRQERFDNMRQAVAQLSETDQEVLHLRREGLRYREIGEVLGLSTSTVADGLRRSIERLRTQLHA